MNVTIQGLRTSDVSIGKNIAGQIANNSARQGFGASVSAWKGGSQSPYAQTQTNSSTNETAASENAEEKKAGTSQTSDKWRHFFSRSLNQVNGGADFSYAAYLALKERAYFGNFGRGSV